MQTVYIIIRRIEERTHLMKNDRLLPIYILIICFIILAGTTFSNAQARKVRYEPNWESLDKRPIPKWFNQAKFGIFVVWGPYSVPAWAPKGKYAEWYGHQMRQNGSPIAKFHRKTYGRDFHYEDFAPMFTAELWDPDFWVDIFVKSGAKYVVTTANYHDGFCLYPSKYDATTRTDQWNSMEAGPRRDLLGELNRAGRKRGLKMGIYYSLYEWHHPLWLEDRDSYVSEKLHPQFREVVTKYKPPVIFLDGEWDMDYKKWRSEELAAWLFNDSPVADIVAVNDRWGKTRGKHGSFYSSEYGGGQGWTDHPWLEDRGIGKSYGYNRNESIFDYDSRAELIRMLSRVAGNGGNFLLDVGPAADGRIPVIMQERLLQIGAWLKINGQAIYGSQPNPFRPQKFSWGTCTCKPGQIFVHIWGRKTGKIELPGLKNKVTKAYLLTGEKPKPVSTQKHKKGLTIKLPPLADDAVSIIVLQIKGEPLINTNIGQAFHTK